MTSKKVIEVRLLLLIGLQDVVVQLIRVYFRGILINRTLRDSTLQSLPELLITGMFGRMLIVFEISGNEAALPGPLPLNLHRRNRFWTPLDHWSPIRFGILPLNFLHARLWQQILAICIFD